MRQAEPPSGTGGADADTAPRDLFKRCEGSSPLRTQNVKSNFGSSHLPVKSAPHSTTTRYFSGSLSLSHNRVNTLSTAFFIMLFIFASVMHRPFPQHSLAAGGFSSRRCLSLQSSCSCPCIGNNQNYSSEPTHQLAGFVSACSRYPMGKNVRPRTAQPKSR